MKIKDSKVVVLPSVAKPLLPDSVDESAELGLDQQLLMRGQKADCVDHFHGETGREMPNPLTVESHLSKATPAERTLEPPGGVLVWIIVLLEILTFGAGLGVFRYQAVTQAAEFAAGRATLNQPLAFANTLILLTGGWCMAVGLGKLKAGFAVTARRWILLACGSGVVFATLKAVEYAEKLQAGHGFGNDAFYTVYFLLTGFHLVHVLVAAVLLAFMARGIRRGHYQHDSYLDVESSGIFWHMCDLIWLLVYPVLYLL